MLPIQYFGVCQLFLQNGITDLNALNIETEARSRMRALDWARAGIKTAQLNDSSHSPNILFSIFSISNGLRYGHKQTLSIYHNI